MEKSQAIAANAYVHSDLIGVNKNKNNTIDTGLGPSSFATAPQQHQTIASPSNASQPQKQRAVSNPKTFMRARMAQQTKDFVPSGGPQSRSKSRHAHNTIELGPSSAQRKPD